MRHKMRFIGLFGLLVTVLILPSIGWGLSSETIMNRQPLHFENKRIDLENPMFQGNFGYRYPVELPAGINGLEPSIALVYNSENNQETYMGVGWSMSGYNQIRRNDRQGTPWYDGRDSFILTLNGKEYLFDANGHPEQGTLRIEGSASSEWRVYEADGTELLFTQAVGKAQGTYLWVLTRMQDTNGNTVTYSYDNSVAASEGVSYLQSIKYQDNLKIFREIRFEYEFFAHAGEESLDPTLSYWPGLKQCYSKRLKSIITDAISYTLEYRTSNSNGRCLLAAIRPSDGEPVTFNYDSDSLDSGNLWEFTANWGLSFLADYVSGQFPRIKDFAVLTRDFNNDGLPDIYVQKHNREWVASFLDLDMDFLPQIYLNDGNGGWVLAYDFINSRSSFSGHYYHYNENPDIQVSTTFNNFEVNQLIDPRFFDLNGDGHQDIVFTVYYYWGAMYTSTGIPMGTVIKWVEKEHLAFLNDGQGRFIFKEKSSEDFQGNTKTLDYLDLDGDGMVDPTPFRTTIMPIPVDANGDRFPDLFSDGRYHVNQGDGTFQEAAIREQELFFRQKNLSVDLNGDGVADKIGFDRVTGQLTCANDNRYDLNLLPDCRFNCALNYVNTLEMFADVDNNGFKDIITLSGVYLNKTKPDLLTGVSGAERIEVSYVRVGVPSQYGDDPQKKGSTIYRWAVEKITADDDSSTFSYSGGLHDLLRREFRGYGQVTVTGKEGATVYTYNPADRKLFGMVQSVTGPDGSVQYNYTFSGGILTHLTTTSNPKNAPTTKVNNDYDNDGNLTRQVQEINDNYLSGIIIRTYEYSKSGKVVNTLKRSYEEGSGIMAKESLYYYDDLNHGMVAKGNLTRIDTIVRPAESGSKNLTVKLNYDGQGIATGITDAFGNTTTTELLTVNAQFKKRVTRNVLGHESYELIETATGLVAESVDPNGAKTIYSYYPDRRLKRVTRPDGGFTEYEYLNNSNGSSVTITKTKEAVDNQLLLWHEEHTDAKGNQVKTLDKQVKDTGADGAGPYQDTSRAVLVTRTYNSRGQVVTETLPYFEGDTPALILYQYEEMESDASGRQHRLLQVTRPDGAATNYKYDDPGRRVTVIDPNGNRTETIESYQNAGIEGYGNLVCRVVTVIDAMQGRTVNYYDLEGNLVQQTDAKGQNKLYYYDSLGRVYKSKDPYKGQVSYAYDENGRLAQKTDAKGQVLTYQYDALSRITAKIFPDNRKIEWLYDLTSSQNAIHTYGIGRLGAYKDKSGTTRLGYDSTGNLIRKEQAGYRLGFSYDLLNRTTGISYPNDYQINYTYDAMGLAEVKQGSKVLVSFNGRNALGQAREVAYANGVKSIYDFDPNSGLLKTVQSINQLPGGGHLLNLSYQHDLSSNVKAVQDTTPLGVNHPQPLNEVYSYDGKNQLIGSNSPFGNFTYQYDSVGNITAKEGVSFTYGDPDHPYAPTSGTSGFKASYDLNGNMVAKTDSLGNQLSLDYDEENQLVRVIKNGSYTENYTYDATGYRVRRENGAIRTDYLYWGNTLLFETTGGKAINYVWAEGKLITKVESSGSTYFSHDHLGSSKLQTDDAGKVLSTDVTKPFGPRICSEAIKDDFATSALIDLKQSKIVYNQAAGVVRAPSQGVNQSKFLANNQTITEYRAAYHIVKAAQFRLNEQDTKQKKVEIRITLTGKARIRVTGEDGKEYLSKEYSTEVGNSYSVTVNLNKAQIYTVTLELAGMTGSVLQSVNNIFEVSWGELENNMGVLYTLPRVLQEDARTVRLSWVGNGVSFDVSTDNGKTWETVENGKITRLKNNGRQLLVRGFLQIDPNTALDSYVLEVNPAGYSLFTGKVLEESTGLVYFGARWYDPEVGRFISVDPAEDGENWYQYCQNDPINYLDPDGEISLANFGKLCNGLAEGFKIYGPKKALDVGIALAVGSGITFGLSALMPILPAAIPVITAVIPYISTAMMVPFIVDMANDLSYLIKNFTYVCLSKNPSERHVKNYGITISKISLDIVGMVTTNIGMKAIMKTGILQKLGLKLGGKVSDTKMIAMGENMKRRVIPQAEEIGADYYKPYKYRDIDHALMKNERWINDQMSAGKILVDYGLDSKRTGPISDFYIREISAIMGREYPYYIDFTRILDGI